MALLPSLFTLDGENTGAKLFRTRLGKYAWLFPNRKWMDDSLDKNTLEKKGFLRRMTLQPAWANIRKTWKDKFGLGQAFVSTFPGDFNMWED